MSQYYHRFVLKFEITLSALLVVTIQEEVITDAVGVTHHTNIRMYSEGSGTHPLNTWQQLCWWFYWGSVYQYILQVSSFAEDYKVYTYEQIRHGNAYYGCACHDWFLLIGDCLLPVSGCIFFWPLALILRHPPCLRWYIIAVIELCEELSSIAAVSNLLQHGSIIWCILIWC